MKLSVVIVNYNVRYFLEQALHSVRKAAKGIDCEIFVVDNHSADGSCEMIKRRFPEVILIENKENFGFSKANNQAIRQSKGEYVLLLNPDTVVEEDCFHKVLDFMDTTPDSGAVGVKMIDGSGHFLPESKRGLPSPAVAFYKIFGLAALFPRSRRFGRYHLGYLDKDKTHVVDVLAGAFMMLRKATLDKTGLLDEDYFMYGEDIDLSYCITKSGYKNYYFPHTTIIHYKGESTKKTSVNFVFTFYRAMIIFAHKHFTQKHARVFGLLIHFAIYVRALAAVIMRSAKKIALPAVDFTLMLSGMLMLSRLWSQFRFDTGEAYSGSVVLINSSIYTLLWMAGLYLAGAYNKRKTFLSVSKGILIGTLAISVFYAFVSEGYRFSRAIIVLGTLGASLLAYADRFVAYWLRSGKPSFSLSNNLRTIIVGNKEEVTRVQDLLVKSKARTEYLGFVSVNKNESDDNHYLGMASQLNEITDLFKVEEIIFCSKDMGAGQIIEWMGKIKSREVLFKIVPEESLFIIGSNNKNTPGDFYTLEIHLSLSKSWEQQKKRVFDIALSLMLMPLSPLLLLVVKHRGSFLRNIFSVMAGERTWVGYAHADNIKLLPELRKGILSPLDLQGSKNLNSVTVQKLNFLYAKDYSVEKDLLIVMKSVRSLGN